MLTLVFVPAIAVFILLIVWASVMKWVNFDYFPLPEYIPKLKYYVFFLPAGLAGWGSMMVAHSYLAGDANVFNLAWPLALVIAFIIWEILGILTIAQAGEEGKVAENTHPRDFIALGIGYLVGVLAGSYQIIVHTTQPPQIIFSLGKDGTEIIFILVAIIFFIALTALIEPRLRNLRNRRRPR